jgi:hypothetical protein
VSCWKARDWQPGKRLVASGDRDSLGGKRNDAIRGKLTGCDFAASQRRFSFFFSARYTTRCETPMAASAKPIH